MTVSVTQIKYDAGKGKRNAFDTNLSQKTNITQFRASVAMWMRSALLWHIT